MSSQLPALNERAQGWLRFLWGKATTEDDWSEDGEPHPWWDRSSTAPTLSFARFDLSESSYGVAVMADVTPAWREVYTRILDELISRHTTYWAAIDWLTQFGPDPRRGDYPQEWIDLWMPKHLVGSYDMPGWTANGTAPWGLQPDPIGADGMLFFKGFFNLLLSFYGYVAGDAKWHEPFQVAGVDRSRFSWSHQTIAELLTEQWAARPEGPHCENTKVWPYCLSAAGLGLQLFDHLHGTRHHDRVFFEWLQIAQTKYWSIDRDKLDWIALYYDPILDHVHKTGPGGGLAVSFYLLPQDRELAERLYHAASRWIGWHNPSFPVIKPKDPRFLSLGLVLAHELGDRAVEARLWDVVEKEYEPRAFGPDGEEFGWWFGFGEKWPRGQLSALLMVAEIGEVGSWWRLFNEPDLTKFDAPTVTGVDFPRLGVSQAWNDPAGGVLHLSLYAAARSARGESTTVRVEQLPDASAVTVRCDGSDFTAYRVVDASTIELSSTVDEHSFQVLTGWRGASTTPASTRSRLTVPGSAASASSGPTLLTAAPSSLVVGTGCPCC